MFDKTLTAAAVAATIEDGMTVGVGGWGPRRKPMALVRELLRSPVKDLTVVAYGGPEVGMLCAAGKVRKLTYGFVSLDAIPVEPWFRRAREAGAFEARELDEGLLQWGLRAAAMRVPFLPTPVGLASDVMSFNPDFRTVRSPYDDAEVLLAMPALKLDVALLHVDRADRRGNVQTLGPDPYFDELFARAAARCYVSCEELVDRIDASHAADARFNLVERSYITGVVPARFGAHPTSNPPAYGWDMEHLRAYCALATQEQGWLTYRAQHLAGSEADYLARAGGESRLAALPVPVF
ncbi:MAG: CoA transferase subunit A [Proteobacteria bacterium]|nr:CoA transferase subunit A [Pseudomonadota bacterium]